MRTGQFFVLPGRTLDGYQFLVSAEADVSERRIPGVPLRN
jgi:hypothetical protein